ncbi:MAG: type II toxin-antitoxin system VapC family toxin [Pseudomonadota bacterium]
MIYLDASTIVSLYVSEPMSLRVADMLAQARKPVVASTWTLLECVSAFSIKARVGSLSATDVSRLCQKLQSEAGYDFGLEQVVNDDLIQATTFIQTCATPLRAGDALHLAICRRLAASLLTLDRGMETAAKALSLPLLVI